MALYQNYVEQLVSAGGQSTASVPSGAANTVVKNYSGRLCRAVVTTTGTATPPANLVFFDNATTNSGDCDRQCSRGTRRQDRYSNL
jgi:hypothetical protein